MWDFELTPEDLEHFNDLNVGWRHLLWAETSGHKDYPFKRLQDISILNIQPGTFQLDPDISTLEIFNPNFLTPQRN